MNLYLQKLWYLLMQWLCRFALVLLFRTRYYGRENIPPNGGVLLLSNHQSFLDPPLVGAGLSRQLCYVARDTLFKNVFFRRLIISLNAIPIKRSTADIVAMKIIIEKLKEGRAVLLFPEATRTYDGKISEIKPGFGLISRRAKVPVVPVLIEGAFDAWPRTKRIFSPQRITIVYGDPIPTKRIVELGDENFAAYLTNILRVMQTAARRKYGKKAF